MLILLKTLGDYCNGEPPLTIPNREVKPICADGTAYCGRVGRCLSYLIPSGLRVGFFFTFFVNYLGEDVLNELPINTCYTGILSSESNISRPPQIV